MKKKKYLLPNDDVFTIPVDPKEMRNGLFIPKIQYEVVARVEMQEVYKGLTLAIPKVLMYYLTHKEMLVMTIILEETVTKGECDLKVKDMAYRLNITSATASAMLSKLRKQGLILESANGRAGRGKLRRLNYKTIQYLNDLVENEDPGVFPRIRKALKNKYIITNINYSDIQRTYTPRILPPNHDPEEEEEYD